MKLFSVAIGVAAGYAAARALEARALGLPLDIAFRLDSILKPVSAVQKNQGSNALVAQQQASVGPQIIDVTPIPVSS